MKRAALRTLKKSGKNSDCPREGRLDCYRETESADDSRLYRPTSPAYAKRMVDRLTSRSKQIGVFPLSGRVVPEFEIGQIREVFLRPYRIIYHIRPNHVEVLGVVHMSRRIQ